MTKAQEYARLILNYSKRIQRVKDRYKDAKLGTYEARKRYQELSRLESQLSQISRDAYSFLSRDAYREMLRIMTVKHFSKV